MNRHGFDLSFVAKFLPIGHNHVSHRNFPSCPFFPRFAFASMHWKSVVTSPATISHRNLLHLMYATISHRNLLHLMYIFHKVDGIQADSSTCGICKKSPEFYLPRMQNIQEIIQSRIPKKLAKRPKILAKRPKNYGRVSQKICPLVPKILAKCPKIMAKRPKNFDQTSQN